jgi:hypothetical protein
MRTITNLSEFKNVLPYASEAFGIYQPLLGWKSKRIVSRFSKGFQSEKFNVYRDLMNKIHANYKLSLDGNQNAVIDFMKTGMLPSAVNKNKWDSIFIGLIQPDFEMALERSATDNNIWNELFNKVRFDILLDEVVRQKISEKYNEPGLLDHMKKLIVKGPGGLFRRNSPKFSGAEESEPRSVINQKIEEEVRKESVIAGLILLLKEAKLFDQLKKIFTLPANKEEEFLNLMRYKDPFELFDPKNDLDKVGLSPIGIVHLFRQYFFEFETFLGSPVGHIWLSPGSTVELIEINTRKTVIERSSESFSETIVKTEKTLTEQDEIADAVKTDNKNETKFGASVNATESFSISEMFGGTANQTASFDMTGLQQTAREQTHKFMRQQSGKISSEIRKNFKSTFKTATEITDSSSKKYILANNTSKLLNYELRRKMRQVGVQVQDIGTYLCWQTYVDEPGRQLGIAELMHIAKSPDLNNIPHPETILAPEQHPQNYSIEIPFIQISEDRGDDDEAYSYGQEVDEDTIEGNVERIQHIFEIPITCEHAGYRLSNSIMFEKGAEDIEVALIDQKQEEGSNKAIITIEVRHINFHGHPPARIQVKAIWNPDEKIATEVAAKNAANMNEFRAKVKQEYTKEFAAAAKERIKLASNIQQRKFEELREEERIVIYRSLIQDLLTKGIKIPDNRTRHLVAELINSIFDVDKMLYFVAPEWWKPRTHFGQTLGKPANYSPPETGGSADSATGPVPLFSNVLSGTAEIATKISAEHISGWGGLKEGRIDNYYITEDSAPAKLGSSLGWLLQLDGDNLRNAFLNAPWVKSVIPIRPGKEKAALNWLKQIEGMNGISKDDMYTGKESELVGKSMIEVLEILAERVRQKNDESLKVKEFSADTSDGANKVSATPVDKVYEHGFYPLQGGFRANVGEDFELFDQWVEVLPTDQVVAVEVSYDPKTGRQI